MAEEFGFTPPADAPADMAAIALLGQGLHDLHAALATLHAQHTALAEHVHTAAGASGPQRKVPDSVPWPLRWADLDRAAASAAWVWLIDWVGWLTTRYQIAEAIPACWAQHPPLVEELTALAAAWYAAYDDGAYGDAPLHWHERFDRARSRLRDWDDATRCRNGTHTPRRLDLTWPDDWRQHTLDTAEADVTTRPRHPDPGGGER
jgi:hypothetical protein